MLLNFQLQRVNRKTVCADENGKEFNALKIFTYCIEFLKNSLLEDINKTISGTVELNHIQFIIPVPAIWDDTAKMFMIEASKSVRRWVFFSPKLSSHFKLNWGFLITFCLLPVSYLSACLSVSLSVHTPFTFSISSPKLGQFQPNMAL